MGSGIPPLLGTRQQMVDLTNINLSVISADNTLKFMPLPRHRGWESDSVPQVRYI